MEKPDPGPASRADAVATALRLVRARLEQDNPALLPVRLVACVFRARCGSIAVDVGFENRWPDKTREDLKGVARTLLGELGFETGHHRCVPPFPYLIVFGAPPTNHERLAVRRRLPPTHRGGP